MIDVSNLVHQCAPGVAPSVLEAIIRTESAFDPLAIHVNGKVRLRSPPATAGQAAKWSRWLIRQGYSVDMGLMQINSRNLASLRLTPEGAFDPCRNIRAGAALLTAAYGRARTAGGPESRALLQAISAYNTGTFDGGFRNGYVAKVLLHDSAVLKGLPLDLTCLLTGCAPGHPSAQKSVGASLFVGSYASDTAISGFGVAP